MNGKKKLRVLDLFSGIGGFSLGLRRTGGFQTVCYVEIEPYCQEVLKARMQDGSLDMAPVWDDITKFDGKPWRGHIDLICGGFPCQDISSAGKKEGIEGKRSGLWAEMHRIIHEVRPGFVFVENVSDLLVRGLGRVLGDLAESGYDAEWQSIPACALGAPHERDRVWIVAYPGGEQRFSRRCKEGNLFPSQWAPPRAFQFRSRREYWTCPHGEALSNNPGVGLQECAECDSPEAKAAAIWGSRWSHADGCGCAQGWCVEPDVGRVVNGLPHRVDRVGALGNAIVPQIAEWIGRRILEVAE